MKTGLNVCDMCVHALTTQQSGEATNMPYTCVTPISFSGYVIPRSLTMLTASLCIYNTVDYHYQSSLSSQKPFILHFVQLWCQHDENLA